MKTEPRSRTDRAPAGEDYAVSLRELLEVVRKRLWAVLLVALVFSALIVAVSLNQTPVYQASNEILVGQSQQEDMPVSLASDVQGLQQITQTVVEAVHSQRVAEAVIRDANLQMSPDMLLDSLSVQPVPETQFITISYVHPDPERAQEVANAVGAAASEQISEVSPGAGTITTVVWEQAERPEAPSSPNPLLNGIVALALGLALGLGLAFLLEYLDDSWRSPEDLERISGMPTFGVIPSIKTPRGMVKNNKNKKAGINRAEGS